MKKISSFFFRPKLQNSIRNDQFASIINLSIKLQMKKEKNNNFLIQIITIIYCQINKMLLAPPDRKLIETPFCAFKL